MVTWIFENTVMASGLALVVVGICRFNLVRPALCHLMWLLVFGVLVLPPLPLGFLGSNLGVRGAIGEWIGPRVEVETIEEEPAAPVKELVEGTAIDLVDLEANEEEAPIAAAIAARKPGSSLTARLRTVPPLTWLIAAWAIGAVLLAGRMQYRIIAFHRRVRSAPPAPRPLRRTVARVARQLGIRAPEVRLIEGVGCPSVWCFGRPRLLWPWKNEKHLESGCEPSLIAHELAHLVRRDHWVSRLEVLATGLLWWNPLFWVIRSQVRHYAELSCDAWALWAYPSDRRAYAEALIDAHEKTIAAPVTLQGLCATDSEFRDFERRLSMIMKKQVSRGISKGTAALAFLATLLVLPAFADETQKPPQKESKETAKAECFDSVIASKKLFGKAEKLFASKEYEDAYDLYVQVLDLEPQNGMAHSRLGYMLVGMGKYEEATRHFQKEIELGHNPEIATYNLACAAALSGNDEKAIAYVQKAVKRGFTDTPLMAEDPDLKSIRGTAQFEEAMKLAEKGMALRKKLKVAQQEGFKEDVLELQGMLSEIVSEDGSLHHGYGISLLNAGRLDEAARAFQRQAKVGYLPGNGWYNTACAQARMGDDEAAIGSLKRAVKLGMSYAGVLEDTDLKSLNGDPRFEELKKLIAAPEIRLKKIEMALKEGDLKAASKGLEQVLANPRCTEKERGWAMFEMGKIQLQTDRYDVAAAYFEKAARSGYPLESAAFHIGAANAAMGNQEQALVLMNQALELGFADPGLMKKVASTWAFADEPVMVELIERAAKHKKKMASSDEKKKQAEKGLKKKTGPEQ